MTSIRSSWRAGAHRIGGKSELESPGQGEENLEKPSGTGKPDVSEDLKEETGKLDVGDKLNETVNRTVDKGRDPVDPAGEKPEKASNTSNGFDETVKNTSESMNDSEVFDGENTGQGQDSNDAGIVEESSDFTENEEGPGGGSGTGGVGLP